MWELAPALEKEVLQKTVFPEGLAFNKKNSELRTERINEIIEESSRLSKEIEENEKGLIANQSYQSLLAGGDLQSSNFISDLKKIIDFLK